MTFCPTHGTALCAMVGLDGRLGFRLSYYVLRYRGNILGNISIDDQIAEYMVKYLYILSKIVFLFEAGFKTHLKRR